MQTTLRNASRAVNLVAAAVAAATIAFAAGCRRPPARLTTAAQPVSNDAPTIFGRDPRLANARNALLRGDYPAVLRLCDAARKLGAPEPEVLELRSEIYASTDYVDREIDTLQRWARVAPRDDHPWLKLFYIYQDLGWYAEAGQAVTKAVRLAPSDPRAHVAGALFYYRSFEPLRGIPEIDRAERLDPSRASLANLRGSLLMKAYKFPEAEAAFRKALARNAADTASQLGLAEALQRQGKTAEAETLYRAVQHRDPENVAAAFQLGVVAEARHDDAEAQRQYETAYRLDKTYGNVTYRLGSLYLRRGRAAEGSDLLRSFHEMEAAADAYGTAITRLQKNPADPAIHYRLARFHIDAGELPQAIAELHRVVQAKPYDRSAQRDLISALASNGRRTEAGELLAAAESGRRRVTVDARQ